MTFTEEIKLKEEIKMLMNKGYYPSNLTLEEIFDKIKKKKEKESKPS